MARSNEAKALGIRMGSPAFELRELCRQHNVTQFSANFALYGDIARRITDVMAAAAPRIETYSIDESFVDLSLLADTDPAAWARRLRAKILREIGVPVSIGIAPSKTLAKLASEIAKVDTSHGGVLLIDPAVKTTYEQYLQQTDVRDIWGVGRKLAPRLRAAGVSNALRLAQLAPRHATQLLGIQGRRIGEELRGVSCIPFEHVGKVQQSIMRGRTFGEDTHDGYVIEAAIASLGARAAAHLRASGQVAARATLLLETNRHKPGYRRWHETVTFAMPTQDTGAILAALHDRFCHIYSERQAYHRLNILLTDLSSYDQLQTDVFGAVQPATYDRQHRRMQAIDAINQRFGKDHVYFAADLSRAWQPRRKLQSPAYTTDWDALPTAKIV